MIEMKEFARGLGYTIRENDWIDHRKFTVRYPSSTIYSTVLDFTYEGCDYVNLDESSVIVFNTANPLLPDRTSNSLVLAVSDIIRSGRFVHPAKAELLIL